MTITGEEIKTGIAIFASITSVVALWVSWWLWRQTNCPIVTAEIKTSEVAGNVAICYDLVIYNCGTRPAVNVRLSAPLAAIDSILVPSAPDIFKREVHRCFSREYQIPLLHHGDRKRNGFGLTSAHSGDNALVYGATLPISVTYADLIGRKYESHMTLVVRDSKYFADSGWKTDE